MAIGTIKKLLFQKCYGLIAPANGDDDIFFHCTKVIGGGLLFNLLCEGQAVSFDLKQGKKGVEGHNVNPELFFSNNSSPNGSLSEYVCLAFDDAKIKAFSYRADGTFRALDCIHIPQPGAYVASSETIKFRIAVEEFDHLINDSKCKEADFQAFFERNPDFILPQDYRCAYPQVQLHQRDGTILIPDFILEPNDSSRFCDLLELKHPHHHVFVGKEKQKRMSCVVTAAAAQLRTYRQFFEDPANQNFRCNERDLKSYMPRMFLIIGRRQEIDPRVSRRLQAANPDLDLCTYDDILYRVKSIRARMLRRKL